MLSLCVASPPPPCVFCFEAVLQSVSSSFRAPVILSLYHVLLFFRFGEFSLHMSMFNICLCLILFVLYRNSKLKVMVGICQQLSDDFQTIFEPSDLFWEKKHLLKIQADIMSVYCIMMYSTSTLPQNQHNCGRIIFNHLNDTKVFIPPVL